MPIIKIQSDILRLLAANGGPESYVAGSKRITRHTSRSSGDIDIFHDREERVGPGPGCTPWLSCRGRDDKGEWVVEAKP